jgi:peptide/nickel transport system substrate-binding protein
MFRTPVQLVEGRRYTMRRMLLVAVCGAAVVAAAASVATSTAGAAASRHGAIPLLRVGGDFGAPSLDIATGNANFAVVSLGLEGLMKLGPSGQVVPNLAARVTQPGRAVYVYHLRHGVKFWDGAELTATDVANAMNYYRFPANLTSGTYGSVKSITASGRYTVVVTLKHPDASWPYVAATDALIFEKRFADAHHGSLGAPGVLTMGTGPWQFDSFDPTSGVELSANPHYWARKVQIARISIKFISDPSAQAIAFRAGQIDVVPGVADPRSFTALTKAKPLAAQSCITSYLSMNTQTAPWSDIHVRRAVAYAINRADLIRADGAPDTQALTTLIPPIQLGPLTSRSGVAAVAKADGLPPFDLAKARKEMAASRHPSGFTTNLDVFSYGTYVNQAQVVAAELKKIGINVKVNDVGGDKWGSEFVGPRNKIGLWMMPAFGCSTPDASQYPHQLLQSNATFNTADYSNRTVDALIKQGSVLTSPAKRLAVYKTILRHVAADVPYVPLTAQAYYGAVAKNYSWSGFSFFEVTSTPWALDIHNR